MKGETCLIDLHDLFKLMPLDENTLVKETFSIRILIEKKQEKKEVIKNEG